jgi:hypothetical protein
MDYKLFDFYTTSNLTYCLANNLLDLQCDSVALNLSHISVPIYGCISKIYKCLMKLGLDLPCYNRTSSQQ